LHADHPLGASLPLVAELEQLERDMSAALGIQSTREPIHLFLFRDRLSYDRYMSRYFRGAPMRRAMFIKSSAPGWVFAYQNADYELDLRHETVHALLHSDLPTVPLWLDEGLAEYYEVGADARVYDNPHLSVATRNAWLFRVPSLPDLESLQDMVRMGAKDYQAAWSWVHFMLHGPPAARRVLMEYLADLRDQRASASLHERLESAMPDWQRQFLKHFRSWRR
jgi:hypothetical protein